MINGFTVVFIDDLEVRHGRANAIVAPPWLYVFLCRLMLASFVFIGFLLFQLLLSPFLQVPIVYPRRG